MQQEPGACPICHMDLVPVETHSQQKGTGIHLNAEQIRLANILTDTVHLRPVGEEITLAATLRENQAAINTMTAKVVGRIERLLVRNTGEYVREGQAVFEVYSETLAAAQQDYLLALQSRQRYGSNDLDFTRLADAARNKLLLWGMNRTQIQSLEQSGQIQNIVTYYSPYSGYVLEMPVVEGGYVAEGSPVLRLADLRTLWVEAQLYVSDLPFLYQTKEALVELPAYPGRVLHGKLEFINPNLETTSKIVLVRVQIPNPRGEYKPGMQAWITLKSKARQTVAVPSNALLQGKDGAVVWVQNALGAFENRMVHTGVSNRDFTEITHGLTTGEVVVISGAYLLNSEYIFKQGANLMEGHSM
ncbi:MAG: efflux RND transporter periplasmic adaptor subunit [Saprospiraceae bacterium]|nr:efflux RND transporter periplasmic adaptor subunit [Saprospiraceae bacterium]